MTEANFGWLIRSVHRWSASMMVLMMILHVFRVYLTDGFKKPCELTWVTGVVLAVLTATFGVTGYSLPWDQIGYWAVKIVTGVPEAIPVIGSPLVELLRGSASKDQTGDNAPAGNERSINLDVEGDNSNTETRDQSHGVKDAGQEGDAPKTTDRSGYYNEDDLQVWKDRYMRRNEDHSRRDAKTGGISAPKEITFKYRRTHPE
ncbi:hypothetical protein TEA_004728 [Camellia sinensis var. sinensis]|uniref:Cytochrome b/b6 N-terminal region profile domain-containing protein n=1 Tax=Camellia sinensis var. sinensis TaxID=542762 RepID=A0A4S4DMC9_CAMSN|nr:hypothetical protein TEA_004728 [Camellia sinensis var. sinensis]